ncbi:MAG: hypothetical protein L0Y35_03265, partial [Flammeovirgaceae bacterium]|nr:hypothetical protein [Flammeovirgaceae bacterium]
MRQLLIIVFTFSCIDISAQVALGSKSKKAIELYTVADNYRVRGQYPEAIDLLNQAIARDKKFTEAY